MLSKTSNSKCFSIKYFKILSSIKYFSKNQSHCFLMQKKRSCLFQQSTTNRHNIFYTSKTRTVYDVTSTSRQAIRKLKTHIHEQKHKKPNKCQLPRSQNYWKSPLKIWNWNLKTLFGRNSWRCGLYLFHFSLVY